MFRTGVNSRAVGVITLGLSLWLEMARVQQQDVILCLDDFGDMVKKDHSSMVNSLLASLESGVLGSTWIISKILLTC